MPLNLPDKLPAIELLKEENIFVIDNSRATQQDIRPLRIVYGLLRPLALKAIWKCGLVSRPSSERINKLPSNPIKVCKPRVSLG